MGGGESEKERGGEREGRGKAVEGSKESDGRMRGVEVKGEGRRAFINTIYHCLFDEYRVY